MGIKNINSLLKAKNQTGIISKHISDYSGKRIAIDFSNYMYKFVYHIKKNNLHKYHYIENMYNLVKTFRRYNITPIFVYDGLVPKEKEAEVQRRIEHKEAVNEKINTLIDSLPINVNVNSIDTSDFVNDEELLKDTELYQKIDTINKLNNQTLYVTEKHKKYCAALFRYLGVPYIYSKKEADDMMGYLYKNDLIDACLSEDTDMLAHGIGVVLRNYNMFNGTLTEFNLSNICTDLNLNFNQFLDMCILCGTDYHKINGIGPKRAYSIIKKYGSIEESMEYIKEKFINNDEFNYINIRSMFNGYNSDDTYKTCIGNLEIQEQRTEKLKQFMKVSCSIDI